MNYSFDKQHAIDYGVDEAIMIYHLQFWIDKNKANKKHFYEGRYWTYNSVEAFCSLFEFWTSKQLRRIIDSLVEQQVIIRGNFNKNPMDKTGWYSFADRFAQMDKCQVPKKEIGSAQKGKAIPYSKTDSNDSLSNDKEQPVGDLFEGKYEPEKNKKFKKPIFEEVEIYFKALGFQQLANEYQDHYTSNGWKVGPNKMSDWQAAARQWVTRYKAKLFELEKQAGTTKSVNTFIAKHQNA